MVRFLAVSFLCCGLLSADQDVVTPVLPTATRFETDASFKWRPALEQSMRALFVKHGFRIAAQPETRRRLGGKFFADYADSLKAVKGWGDGDNIFINYVNHPIQGGVTNYIYLHNSPGARGVEFGNTREYWSTRLKALVWTTAWSTQFEIGPLSEASIGNVGQKKGSAGYVDFVVTPAGGFALTVAEDWIDKRFIQRWEANTSSIGKRTFLRIALNPSRALANLLQGKGPWHREGRSLLCAPKAACP
jgi:hypothetical protein